MYKYFFDVVSRNEMRRRNEKELDFDKVKLKMNCLMLFVFACELIKKIIS